MRSMTGFGQSEGSACGLIIEVVIKSVNHKSLDLSVRMPRSVYAMENAVRNRVQADVRRGRVEVLIQIRPGEAQLSTLTLDVPRADAVKNALDILITRYGLDERPGLGDWMHVPDLFVESPSEMDEEELEAALIGIADAALKDFIAARVREGEGLREQFEKNLEQLEASVSALSDRISVFNAEHEKKIRAKVDEILTTDPELMEYRLQQELIFYLEKADIREELTRLGAHCAEFRKQMQAEGPVGKRLDFLLQEMNREANTIASKSQQLLQTQAAIDMKVQIEQMREQIMNIE